VAYCFYHAQKSMIGFCNNFPSRIIGTLIRVIAYPLGQSMSYPSDKLDHQLAQLMQNNNDYRNQLLKHVYLSGDPKQPVDKMEFALQSMLKNSALLKKIKDLKRFKSVYLVEKMAEKVAKGELKQDEMDILVNIEKARWDAIQVDEFDTKSMKNQRFDSLTDHLKSPFVD
jgi:acyl-CoA dehydrogenase